MNIENIDLIDKGAKLALEISTFLLKEAKKKNDKDKIELCQENVIKAQWAINQCKVQKQYAECLRLQSIQLDHCNHIQLYPDNKLHKERYEVATKEFKKAERRLIRLRKKFSVAI